MTITVTTALPTRRITRVEYERLAEIGFFHPDERLELLDGLLVVREPQQSPHERLSPAATVTPLAAPAARVAVADLLP